MDRELMRWKMHLWLSTPSNDVFESAAANIIPVSVLKVRELSTD